MNASPLSPRRGLRLEPLSVFLAALGLAFLATSGFFLFHTSHERDSAWSVSASVFGIGCAALLLAFAMKSIGLKYRNRDIRRMMRKTLAGTIVCYIGSLLLADDQQGAAIFVVLASTWIVGSIWLSLFADQQAKKVAQWCAARPIVALGWTAYVAALAPLLAEAGLRGYSYVGNDPLRLTDTAQPLKLTPGKEINGRTVNRAGYWDNEFSAFVSPGVIRVAVVGGELTQCGNDKTNFLARVEARASNLEVYNFGLPRAGIKEYASQATHDLPLYHPDLVIAVISVDLDGSIATTRSEGGFFDRRKSQLVQLADRMAKHADAPPEGASSKQASTESDAMTTVQIEREAASLAICRTPIPPAVQDRWRTTFAQLDKLVDNCRERSMPLALVIAPTEYQVSEVAWRQICRRTGYDPAMLDRDLPQRRLAEYAQARDVAMLDLLPHFRLAEQAAFIPNQHTLSDNGHRIAAEALGGWLASQYRDTWSRTAQIDLGRSRW